MSTPEFAICLDNRDCEVSLERKKVYEVLPDAEAEAKGQLRVIDESGEDYLYPSAMFLRIHVESPEEARQLRAV